MPSSLNQQRRPKLRAKALRYRSSGIKERQFGSYGSPRRKKLIRRDVKVFFEHLSAGMPSLINAIAPGRYSDPTEIKRFGRDLEAEIAWIETGLKIGSTANLPNPVANGLAKLTKISLRNLLEGAPLSQGLRVTGLDQQLGARVAGRLRRQFAARFQELIRSPRRKRPAASPGPKGGTLASMPPVLPSRRLPVQAEGMGTLPSAVEEMVTSLAQDAAEALFYPGQTPEELKAAVLLRLREVLQRLAREMEILTDHDRVDDQLRGVPYSLDDYWSTEELARFGTLCLPALRYLSEGRLNAISQAAVEGFYARRAMIASASATSHLGEVRPRSNALEEEYASRSKVAVFVDLEHHLGRAAMDEAWLAGFLNQRAAHAVRQGKREIIIDVRRSRLEALEIFLESQAIERFSTKTGRTCWIILVHGNKLTIEVEPKPEWSPSEHDAVPLTPEQHGFLTSALSGEAS